MKTPSADVAGHLAEATVALVGLGNMGRPMGARLVAAGRDVIGVDPDPAARDRFAAAGARVASTVGDASGAGILVLLLPNSDVVDSVVAQAVAAGVLRSGSLVVDMSSSDPERTRALAGRLAEHGVALVDAPVSGGVGGAEAGTLTVMAAGEDRFVAAVRPMLEVFGTVRHVGPVGAGHAVKALNNLVSATHLWITSEVVTLAGRYGVAPQTVLDVLNGSSGRSGSSEAKWPKFILPGTFDSGFAASLMLKDIRTATGLAAAGGPPTELGEIVERLWARAVADLPDGADHTEVARWLADREGTRS